MGEDLKQLVMMCSTELVVVAVKRGSCCASV